MRKKTSIGWNINKLSTPKNKFGRLKIEVIQTIYDIEIATPRDL